MPIMRDVLIKQCARDPIMRKIMLAHNEYLYFAVAIPASLVTTRPSSAVLLNTEAACVVEQNVTSSPTR